MASYGTFLNAPYRSMFDFFQHSSTEQRQAAKSHCQIDRPFKRIVALLYFYKVRPPPVECKWSATVLSGKTRALIDYLWPLCLIVGKPVKEKRRKGRRRRRGGEKGQS